MNLVPASGSARSCMLLMPHPCLQHVELIHPRSRAADASSSAACLKSVLNWSVSVMSPPFAKG